MAEIPFFVTAIPSHVSSRLQFNLSCKFKQHVSRTLSRATGSTFTAAPSLLQKRSFFAGHRFLRSQSLEPTSAWAAPPLVRLRPSWFVILSEAQSDGFSTNSKSVEELNALGKEVSLLLKGTTVFLVGMMGSGKSTVGKEISSALGYSFLDMDTVIEQVTKKSIPQIFDEEGEDEFRTIETQVLSQICGYGRCVVSTGGGVVIRPINWGLIRQGIVVWLDAPVDELHKRLSNDQQKEGRPLLASAEASDQLLSRLTDLMKQRRSLYEQSDIVVPDAGHGVRSMAWTTLSLMLSRLLLEKEKRDEEEVIRQNNKSFFNRSVHNINTGNGR
mmetsp:Transcript_10048/g.17091  ORF Transcript_10048/g.17091 Transcript_10048/m.17091 type:complete len:329 (-) Transcript_10048:11-997(-)